MGGLALFGALKRSAHIVCTFITRDYYLLDISQSLRDNLAQKTVVEFPEFHVVLEQCSKQYTHHPTTPDTREFLSTSTWVLTKSIPQKYYTPQGSSDQEAQIVDELCIAPSEKHATSILLPEVASSLVMLAQSYAECTDSE